MINEALELCQKCRVRQQIWNPQSVACAFRADNMYCDRILDIEALIKKLLHKTENNAK